MSTLRHHHPRRARIPLHTNRITRPGFAIGGPGWNACTLVTRKRAATRMLMVQPQNRKWFKFVELDKDWPSVAEAPCGS